MSYCLAIDIGASSGRHILGEFVNGKVKATEIYRFANGIKEENEDLVWDIEELTKNVIEGIKKCGELGVIPKTVAIDTWGVDYVLLDKDLNEILPVYSYRDARTKEIPRLVDEIIPMDILYKTTGVQRQDYNTVYQLFSDKLSGRLNEAEHFLMMPEYLSYKLTGIMKSEYTIASTTSLLNATTNDWDKDIIKKLGIKDTIFKSVFYPGEIVGKLKNEIKEYVGFDTTVVFVSAHDTASAVSACSCEGNGMFISSGTWSITGVIKDAPLLMDEAYRSGLTNEGVEKGAYGVFKNIMGMWLLQSIKRDLENKYSYDEMMEMAKNSQFTETFDPNDQRLVAPQNMIEAIRECLLLPDLPIEDVISSVYYSLANSYKKVTEEIELVTRKKVDFINIIGGGSKDKYLNELTGLYTKKTVITGPSEATAIGNLKTQFRVIGEI